MLEPARYWFPAKRYGLGWGLPSSWQGWVVLAAYVSLLAAGALLLPPASAPFLAFAAILTALLTAICWARGEPPRWRWGKE